MASKKKGFKFTDSIQASEDASVTPPSPDEGYALVVSGTRDGWKDGDYWAAVDLKHPKEDIEQNPDLAGRRYDYFLGLGIQKKSRRENLVRLQKCLGFDPDYVMESIKELEGRVGRFAVWVKEDSETKEKKNGVKPILPKVNEPDEDNIVDDDDDDFEADE